MNQDSEHPTTSPISLTQLHHGVLPPPTTDPNLAVSKDGNNAAIPSAISDDPREFDSCLGQFSPITDFGTNQHDAITAAVRQTFTSGNAKKRDQSSTREHGAAALLQGMSEKESYEAGAAAFSAYPRRVESENDFGEEEEDPNVTASVESPVYRHRNNLRVHATEGTTNHAGETESNRSNTVNTTLTHDHYLRGYTKCKDCRSLARKRPNCKNCKTLPNVDKRSAREDTLSLAETSCDDLAGKKTQGAASNEEAAPSLIPTPLTKAATPPPPSPRKRKRPPLIPGLQQATLASHLYASERAQQEKTTAAHCARHSLSRADFESQHHHRLAAAGAPTPEQQKRDAAAMDREVELDMARYMQRVYSPHMTTAALHGLPMPPIRVADASSTSPRHAKRNPLRELESTLLVAPLPVSMNGGNGYAARRDIRRSAQRRRVRLRAAEMETETEPRAKRVRFALWAR